MRCMVELRLGGLVFVLEEWFSFVRARDEVLRGEVEEMVVDKIAWSKGAVDVLRTG